MTYAVLTTKHVSGFSLWDSEFTEYGVMHPACPYNKDIVAQFVKSFTSRGSRSTSTTAGASRLRRGVQGAAAGMPTEPRHARTGRVPEEADRGLMRKYPECFYIWHDGYDEEVLAPPKPCCPTAGRCDQDVLHGGNWWDWKKKGNPFLDVALKEMRDIRGNTAVAEPAGPSRRRCSLEPGIQNHRCRHRAQVSDHRQRTALESPAECGPIARATSFPSTSRSEGSRGDPQALKQRPTAVRRPV